LKTISLLLLLGCAANMTQPATPVVRIEVQNNNWARATVTMISPSQPRYTVGRIPTAGSLVVTRPLRRGSGEVRFHIRLLAGESYLTEYVILSEGQTIVLVIGARIQNTTLYLK